jgi:hypothetical protein
MAIIPLSGVRISWLMFAKNIALASIEASATALAAIARRSSS